MTSGIYQHKPCKEETKIKISIANIGKEMSEETRKKMSLAKIGKPSPNKGKIFSLEHRKNLSISHKGKMKGINNTNYKNGKYTEENRKKCWHYVKSFDYKQWRISVFERDNYKCQGCQQVGGYLTAHHIKSWANYPKLRYEVNNGVTLCEKCHKLTDNYKGKQNGNY